MMDLEDGEELSLLSHYYTWYLHNAGNWPVLPTPESLKFFISLLKKVSLLF